MSNEEGSEQTEGVEQTEDVEIDSSSTELNFVDPQYDEHVKSKQSQRYQGPINGRWTGVKSCCDQDRVNSEANAAFRRWLDGIRSSNPTWTIIRAGTLPGGRAKCQTIGGGFGSSGRRCNGHLESFTGYVEYV